MRVLELGGGSVPYYCKAMHPDYCNMDVRPIENVDHVYDFNRSETLPFGDDEPKWDKIFSRYCLEHISWRKMPQFIAELYRILKPGGRVYIVTANLKAQAEILCRELPFPPRRLKVHNEQYQELVDIVRKDDLQRFIQNTTGMIFGDHDYAENAHAGSMGPEVLEMLFRQAGFSWVVTYEYWQWHGDLVIEAQK